MNYWCAEMTGLGSLTIPLFDYIEVDCKHVHFPFAVFNPMLHPFRKHGLPAVLRQHRYYTTSLVDGSHTMRYTRSLHLVIQPHLKEIAI